MERTGYLFLKRVFDITAGLAGIVITMPIWIAAMIGILISDPGPVFFHAERLGKDNHPFCMWKFRSMRVPKNHREQSEASFKADTRRIFPWGETMRRLKIDELPQLLNVVNGTMSVVGPRPAAKDQAAIMRSGAGAAAASVKPGLTGPAALYDYIYGDSVEDPEDYKQLVLPTRLFLEGFYPEHMGIIFDLQMIFFTVECIACSVLKKTPEKILTKIKSYENSSQ